MIGLAPLSKISYKGKTLLICGGTLLILIGFYFLIIKPRAADIQALQNQVRQQRLALEEAQLDLRNMPDPEEYHRQLQAEEARVKALLPDNDAISEFLVTLNTLSKGQNVRVESIKQGALLDRKNYYEIPLDVTVTGNYPNLLRFINKLETAPRLNSITKITVRGEEPLLSMQLAMLVYVNGPLPQSAKAEKSK